MKFCIIKQSHQKTQSIAHPLSIDMPKLLT
uniref:Uncharacterized protein n=1 Tax=Rhizophora mucronata TaxID=61149 RepID=A0A2P2QGS0_RHIMU